MRFMIIAPSFMHIHRHRAAHKYTPNGSQTLPLEHRTPLPGQLRHIPIRSTPSQAPKTLLRHRAGWSTVHPSTRVTEERARAG